MTNGIARAPFLDVQSFAYDEGEAPRPAPTALRAWSPFLSVYEDSNGDGAADVAVREAYSSLVTDLYDEEFDDSLFELLTSARTLHQDHIATGHSTADADRIVTQHFSQLLRESESMIDAMAREFQSRDVVTIDREMDLFAERYAPVTPLEPEFQEFLGKLAKKIGRGVRAIAKTAVKTATTLGIGPVLNRIKALVRPLLNRVLQKAIGKLPAAIQPAARTLAERLGLASKPAPAVRAPATAAPQGVPTLPATEPASDSASTALDASDQAGNVDAPATAPEDVGSPVQALAGPDVPDMQRELDEMMAEALLSPDERQWELASARAASSAGATQVVASLDEARERLIHELETLKEGESPAPYVESFLPAVLPALKIATRLIGRPRIVQFLAGLLGKLISNLVGPQHAPALSRAIVDAGLKLVSLELGDQKGAPLAASAVAATLEETLTRVASLPDHILDNEQLLEGFALEAFEQAAAANLPAVFPEATYRKRPDLLEGGVNASWITLPLRRPRYKRCSRTFNVTITPHMAEAIEGFDALRLSDYLQDQLGLPEGEDVEAEVHLYEVLAGGTAADIARFETETPGLGAADEATLSQLQPLTDEAASVLLGKPGLGRSLRAAADIRTLGPGQRVFHMVVGRRPVTVGTPSGRVRVRRPVRLNVVVDVPGDHVRVSVFLSEVKAQQLAVGLRKQSHIGSMAVQFHKLLSRRLAPLVQGRRSRRLRIVHADVTPGAASTALDRLPPIVRQTFVTKMGEWLTSAFTEFAKTQAATFLAASEAPADGVTLAFRIEQPPGLKEIGQLLSEKGPAPTGVAERIARSASPSVRVEAFPGYKP